MENINTTIWYCTRKYVRNSSSESSSKNVSVPVWRFLMDSIVRSINTNFKYSVRDYIKTKLWKI